MTRHSPEDYRSECAAKSIAGETAGVPPTAEPGTGLDHDRPPRTVSAALATAIGRSAGAEYLEISGVET